jgi:alpha-glucosidase (family GH31 glycosyl hydrolase)
MRRYLLAAVTSVVSTWLVFAATSSAAVSVSRSRVVVSLPGASAIVDRDPFRLRVVSGRGRRVLSEVANRGQRPVSVPPTIDPIPPGTDSQKSDQLYAPLSFLVGEQSIMQYPGGVWGGNLMSGMRSGVQYSARKVIAARTRGLGVLLTVSTSDPSGRTLHVEIGPAGGDLIRVTATAHPASGVALLSDSFSSSRTEAFYGFGGRHNALDQHGNALSSFVLKENLPGLGAPGSPAGILFPNGPAATFYPQAQFISSRGYGFLLAQPQLAWFRLDSDRPRAWSVSASASSLNYVVAVGAPKQAIPELTALTGRQPAPPRWALGPMMDRLVRNGSETPSDYESHLKQDIVNIDRYHMPLTGYRIEGWRFPNPDNDGLVLYNPPLVSFATQSKIIAELRARHIHPLAYVRPFITPGSAPDREGLTVHLADGQTATTTGTLGQHIAELDFTNPAAVRWWARELAKMLDLGFDGFLADFGEEVLYDWHFADGQTGRTMHNGNPVLYMRATRDAVDAYERSHPGRKVWFYYAGGYSGTPGSAAYEGGNLPGDEATNWGQASGLASLAPDMLSRTIGGAYGFTTDIGGYYDVTTPPTTKQLFLRWAEWAALSPIFRLHGSGLAGTHTPWSYDRQTVNVYRSLSLLHERAAPLILRLWQQADRTGIPPTRPLWLEFPGDERAAAQQQEWTLGDDVLVAPVVVEGATSRSMYVPSGCWREPDTGLVLHGRRTVSVRAPLTMLPYFFRCGTNPFATRASLRPPAKPPPPAPPPGLG